MTAVADAVQMAYLRLSDPRRPYGVFLFAGPTGVGKTELARALAEQLFGDERPCCGWTCRSTRNPTAWRG